MKPTLRQRFIDFITNKPDEPPEIPQLRKVAFILGSTAMVAMGMATGVLWLSYIILQAHQGDAAYSEVSTIYALAVMIMMTGPALYYCAFDILINLAERPRSFLRSKWGKYLSIRFLPLALWFAVIAPYGFHYFVHEFNLPEQEDRLSIIQARTSSLLFEWGWIFVLAVLFSFGYLALINYYRNYYRNVKMLSAGETK